ncbi:hypothetical protein [Rhodoferax saidenbachensis]|uniref:Uncharacterized protein n=1 Tax=Rhodoferax saidenbachensis TaxID=1484693 RepID=A0ABU1ZKG6_9BURK|nr:hypothetical protein [Rhodoferax saidenbachensis]MDR7305365.1 hypothetical protein [Rhodoferax saidenbachensis]
MPLTLFDQLAGRWLDEGQRAQLQAWAYRIGIYVVFNLLDEPVWLALMFC